MNTNTTNRANDAITFADILFIIRKNVILLLAITALFGIGGGIYGFRFTKPTYTAMASVMVSKPQSNTNNPDIDYNLSLNMVQSCTSLFSKDAVAIKTSDALSEKYEMEIDYKEIKNSVKASYTQYDLFIIIEVTTARDQQFAIDMANQLVDSAIDYVNNELEDENQFKPLANKIIPVDYAKEATINNNSKMILILSVIIGFVLGMVVIVIKHLLNDTFTSREEFERLTGLNVLVMLPNPVFKGDSNVIQEK